MLASNLDNYRARVFFEEYLFIIDNKSIIPGKVLQYLSAQSVAHLLMVIFIILGNVSYYYSRRTRSEL